MTELFLKLLSMSLSASWVVLAVMALRLVLKKAPRWVNCMLWGLVAFRLLCPFSFESVLSLMPEAEPIPQEVLVSPAPAAVPAEVEGITADTPEREDYLYLTVPAADGTEMVTDHAATVSTVRDWLDITSAVWVVGIGVLLAYAAISYLRLRRKVSASIDIGNGVYICDYIDSPFILGIVKPKIYLSSAMDPRDAAHVLAHERAHLSRKDHWWKPLGFVLLSVYWFNPLLWAAYVLLCRDIELACDERVIRKMDIQDKKAYSEALLKCSVPRHMIVACPLAFGEVGVKERVKSVLNYKKPGFWIVLIAVIVVIAVAVCFLTDPEGNTLANFQEIEKNGIVCIDIFSSDGEVCLDAKGEIADLFKVLDAAEYDPHPVSQERREDTLDEYLWKYPYIEISYEEGTVIFYFTYDYTQFWVNDGVKPSNPYTVKNPDVIADFMQKHIAFLYNEPVTAAPFASIDEPWQWMQNVQTDAIREVRISWAERSDLRYSSLLSMLRFEELLAILRDIPRSAITNAGIARAEAIETVMTSEPNAAVRIADAANDIGIVIRFHGETVEIAMCEGMDAIVNDRVSPENITKWEIKSHKLLAFLQEEYESPSVVSTSLYSRYDLERIPATVSHGNAAIRAIRFTDWDYETVEYTEGAASFGIRCRPKAVDKGWLYFSFWPDGYDPPEEENRYYEEYSYTACYAVTSWPAGVKTPNTYDTTGSAYSYSLREYSIGDFVIINEGADEWFAEYQDVLRYQDAFVSFEYGKRNAAGDIRTYGDVTVDFTSDPFGTMYSLCYFDWDQIAVEIGAKELILFDPQEFNDLMFVGCQYGDNYTIAVFQKNDKGYYHFVEILTPYDIRRETYDEQTVLIYADYETDDSSCRVYLLTNENITACSYRTTYEDYVVLDRCPAIIVLDTSEKDSLDYIGSFRVEYEEPIQFSHQVSFDGKEVQFESAEDDENLQFHVDYITTSQVWFYDKTTFPGHFYLTQEEVLQFRDILLSLSPEEIEPGAAEKNLITQLSLTCKDGIPGDGEIWRMGFAYENGSVSMELWQCANFRDSEGTQYLFTVRNDELNAFLESLCDSDRTQSEVFYNNFLFDPEGNCAEYTCDYASIRIPKQEGWVYKTVEYTDDDTPFGIRCRPEWAEGWLFFSYWPSGFTPSEEGTYQEEGSAHSGYVQSYPEKPVKERSSRSQPSTWTYTHYNGLPGDYVILNEGAENWLRMENGYWPIYALYEYTTYAEGLLTKAEIVQIVRELYPTSVNATGSNLTTQFDFHTGIWTVCIPAEDTGSAQIAIQIDTEGNVLPQAAQ